MNWFLSYILYSYFIFILLSLSYTYSYNYYKCLTVICVYYFLICINIKLYIQITQYYYYILYYNSIINIVIIIIVYKIILNIGFLYRFSWCLVLMLWCYPTQLYNNIITGNIDLFNGIVFIHPVILFMFYSFILFFSIIFFVFFKNIFFLQKYLIHSKNKNTLVLMTYLYVISVILGAWWAEQELLWGGWWSWDFIEILSLSVLMYGVLYNHMYIITNNMVSKLFLHILTIIVIVRFNIINSIHNFLVLDIENQYLYYIVAYVLFTIYRYKQHTTKNNLLIVFTTNIILYQVLLLVYTTKTITKTLVVLFIFKHIFYYIFIYIFIYRYVYVYYSIYMVLIHSMYITMFQYIIFLYFFNFFFFLKNYLYKNIQYSILSHLWIIIILYVLLQQIFHFVIFDTYSYSNTSQLFKFTYNLNLQVILGNSVLSSAFNQIYYLYFLQIYDSNLVFINIKNLFLIKRQFFEILGYYIFYYNIGIFLVVVLIQIYLYCIFIKSVSHHI